MLKKLMGVFLFIFCIIFALAVAIAIFHSFIVENELSQNGDAYNFGVIIGKIFADIILIYLLYKLTKFSIRLISNKKPIESEIDKIGQQE